MKKKRVRKVLIMQMRHRRPVGLMTLDVILLPSAIADEDQVVLELAEAYKRKYLEKNPQCKRFKFFYHVVELR